ncbi:hypothetical protein V6N13_048640 [Hibiscus sabdariffa]
MSQIPYASAIGSIMYAMICTRPDLSYALSMTSRYQANPGEGHWTAVKNILKYLRRTKDVFLVYGGEEELRIKGYTDASFQTDKDDSRSQSGFVFCLNGGAVSWKSSKQDTVADSTTEAEYIAASEAAKEAVWIKKFITELGVIPSITDVVDLYCDNNGAIAQAKEPRSHQRSKHILRRFHLIREIIDRGDVEICKVNTDDNIADPLTKPLAQLIREGISESFCSLVYSGELRRDTAADSTTEAEYIAASEAAKEAVWIKKFITGLGVIPSISDAVDLYCDKNGAIAQAKEPRSHQRSKHILRRFHLICEIIDRGDVEICKVHTDDNIADPLTKPLAQQKHDRHTESLSIRYIKTLAAQTLFPPLDLRRLLLAREQGCAIFRLFGKEYPSSCSLVYSGGLSRDLDEIFVEIQDPKTTGPARADILVGIQISAERLALLLAYP